MLFHSSYATGESYSLTKKNILVINSYNKGLKWTDDIVLGIESVLQDKANIYVEYMDTKRIYDDEYYNKLKELFSYKFKNYSFDAIITSDVNALVFMTEQGAEIFPDTPLVFCGVNDVEIPETLLPNTTGVIETIDIKRNIDLALSFHNKAKNIFVISDSNETGKNNRAEAGALSLQYKDITFQYATDFSMDEIIEKVSKMGEETIILALSYVKDSQGNIFSFQDVAKLVSSNTKAPFYGTWDFYIESGTIGGYVASGFYQGEKAGELTSRILEGENPESIPIIEKSPNKYIFDYEKLREFDIKESSIPKDSIIVNRPPSFYEENKLIVNLTASFLLFLIIIIIVLLLNISKRKAIEKDLIIRTNEVRDLNINLENRIEERTLELRQSNDKLKETLDLLKETQRYLIEREKISALGDLVGGVAHEINTPIGIALTGVTYLVENTKDIIEKLNNNILKKAELEKYLSSSTDTNNIIQSNINRASKVIRSFKQIAIDQSTGDLQTINLKKYFEDVVLSLHPELKKTRISLEIKGSNDIEITTYPGDIAHILTNLIINTISHGYEEYEEGKIIITIDKTSKEATIHYKDFGKGIKNKNLNKIFEPFFTTARGKGGTGLGLNIVYNLVTQRLKGTIICESVEGKYTEFILTIPLEKNTIKPDTDNL
ncbi:MAG: sensor histidine kinase [Tissierellales bacterium]